MRTIAILLGAAVALTACETAPPPPPPPPPAPALPPDSPLLAANYLPQAASGDQFEIQSSQLALQMSQNPAVRSFAQMLITDHTKLSGDLAAAAQTAGLPAPAPMMLPPQQAALDQLRAAGPNFDMAFRDAQVGAHQQALDLHQNYANGGDVPPLRTAASSAVPVIQSHLTQAQALSVAPPPPPPPPPAGERG